MHSRYKANGLCLKGCVVHNYTKLSVGKVLQKSAHGWSTLQVHHRREWVLFQMFLRLTTKEHPCDVYSDSMLLKQILGHTIMYNKATSSFEVKTYGTQHSEWHHVTMSMVWLAVHATSVYAKLPCNNLQ